MPSSVTGHPQQRTHSIGSAPTTAPTPTAQIEPIVHFFKSIQAGDEGYVRLYLSQGVDIEKVDDASGLTPLLTAAKSRRTEVCRILLMNEPKAKINAIDKEKRGVLHLALCKSGGEDMIELLLCHGADPDAVDSSGSTPLHYCANFNKPLALRCLLAKKAKKETLDNAGRTALQCAIEANKPGLVKVLYDAGAEVDISKDGDVNSYIRSILQGRRNPDAALATTPPISKQNSATTTNTMQQHRSLCLPFSRRRS